MVTNFKKLNTELAESIFVSEGAIRKELLDEFLMQNNTLVTKIAYSLLKPGGEYDDVFVNVQLATVDILTNSPNAVDYIENFTFWTVVTNRAKEQLHYEKGTGINYQTFKRNVRNNDIPSASISIDDDILYDGTFLLSNILQVNSVEKEVINKNIKDDFDRAFSTLTEREQRAISCKKFPEYDGQPISRRTYCRARASARRKMIALLSYERDDYEEVFGN